MTQAALEFCHTRSGGGLGLEIAARRPFGRRQNHGHALAMAGSLLCLANKASHQDVEKWVALSLRAATPSLSAAVAGVRRDALVDAPATEVLLALADCLQHLRRMNDWVCLRDSPAHPLLDRLHREARELGLAVDGTGL